MHDAFGMTYRNGLAKDMCWRKQRDRGQDQGRALPALPAKEIGVVHRPVTSVGISFVVRKHGSRLGHENGDGVHYCGERRRTLTTLIKKQAWTGQRRWWTIDEVATRFGTADRQDTTRSKAKTAQVRR